MTAFATAEGHLHQLTPESNAMSKSKETETVAVRFQVSPDDPHVETVVYALRGVALALDDESLSEDRLERRQMDRIAGLAAAAALLTGWLTYRLDGSYPAAVESRERVAA